VLGILNINDLTKKKSFLGRQFMLKLNLIPDFCLLLKENTILREKREEKPSQQGREKRLIIKIRFCFNLCLVF
jgi:hypothetical protein